METEIGNPSDQIIANAREAEAERPNSGPMMPGQDKPPKSRPGPKPGTKQKNPRRSASQKDNSEDPKKDNSNSEDIKKKFEIPSSVICMPVIKGMSGMAIYALKDKRAAITPDEAEAIAQSMGMVLDKWMPELIANYGPELMLGLSLGQYGMRLYALNQVIQEQTRKQEAARQAASTQGTANGEQMRPQGDGAQIHSLSEATPIL